MKFSNEELWNTTVANNQDFYGTGVCRFAKAWAELMEKRKTEDNTIASIAEQASHDADTDGITGFMYGCAVEILSECWIHGEALRQWHNLKTQIGTEGEKANAEGTVLNPALLSIGGSS